MIVGSLTALRRHVDTIGAILWNHGADVSGPHLSEYDGGGFAFTISADLPGHVRPRPAEMIVSEVWLPIEDDRYRRTEYAYDFVDHPARRRRAFHAHDRAVFASEFDTVTHEHCEEVLGQPRCEHYVGFPLDAYDALQRLTALWGQTDPLGCDDLRCLA